MRNNIHTHRYMIYIYIYVLQASGGPSPSQVHHNKEKDQHYLPLDHKKGGKVAGSKDKPSSTQGGSGEEYSALGNRKVYKADMVMPS